MKKVCLFIIAMQLLVISLGYCENISVELRESVVRDYPKLKGFPNLVYKVNLIDGYSQEVCDLNNLGIIKPINYFYDEKIDILFINEYNGRYYNIQVVDLGKKKLIKTITLDTTEPDIYIITNPINSILYVSYYNQDETKYMTNIYDSGYNLLKKTSDFVIFTNRQNNNSFLSKDGSKLFTVNYDQNTKKEYFIEIDSKSGNILKKKEMQSLVVNGKYGAFQDSKNGIALIGFTVGDEQNESNMYILFDPAENKIISKIDKLPYSVGEAYLDDSKDNIIVNDAKLVDLGNNKKQRKYLNRLIVYSFAKKGKVKEISIKEGSKIEAVKAKIYLRQDSTIHTEELK